MSLTILATTAIALLAVALIVRFLTTPIQYPEVDLREIDRAALAEEGERLLQRSASWSTDLEDDGVVLSSSLEPFAVRTVRYQVDVETDFERAIIYLKNMSDCGEKSRESKDKFEETLYDKDREGANHEWIRRSVHISPPPGANRDAVVAYFQDRPSDKSYRIAFQSVDSIDGKAIPVYEGASRFMVNPALYTAEETSPGHVRILKIEAVDPQGMVSPFLNNYFISLAFFRKYMFVEAKAMRDALASPAG